MWTDDPACIPTEGKLSLAEPEATVEHTSANMRRVFDHLPVYLMRKKILMYHVRIHIRNVIDFTPRSPSPASSWPSSDADNGHDGHPDCGYRETRGYGPHF